MQAQDDVRVTVRVEKMLKENAEILFNRLGMNMSVAFNVFLRKAVDEQAIPFTVGLKSSEIARKYSPDEITASFQNMVAEDISSYMYDGHPIARYNPDADKAYFADTNSVAKYTDDSE